MNRQDTEALRTELAAIKRRASNMARSQGAQNRHGPVTKLANDMTRMAGICEVLLNSITAYKCDEPSDVPD